MSFYIGGETQEFEFDFFTKTANSVVDCPMKIYKGEVDPDNLPSPTDPLWKEITSQNIIDKLKEQNEITASNLATDRSTIQWGDKTLTKTNVIKIVDDFKGKIRGSVVENPNKVYVCVAYSLRTPTDITGDWRTGFEESVQENINKISSLDNSCYTATTGADIPQQLFSFNLVEIVERKYGSIPKETVAEKIEWLKDNLYSISCNWYGYGSCPSGNKAMLICWYVNMSGWNTTTKQTHNASTSTLLRSTRRFAEDQQGYDMIDNNGFVHYLAYTDASDGVTPSTICTDYISIELTLKIPEAISEFYDFYTDSNNRRDAGLTNIVLVKKPIEGEPQDTTGYNYFTNESAEISVTTDNKASAFLIECDLSPIANSLYGGSNSALKSALKSIEANVWAMGSGANGNELGYGVKLAFWQSSGSIYSVYPTTSNASTISKLTIGVDGQANSAWVIGTINKFYIIVYSTYKSNGSIPSEVNLDYVNIKVKLTRTPDNIPPIPIELGTKWSILIKGFSPSWGNKKPMVSETRYLSAVKEDNSDVFTLYKGNVNRETKIWWKNLSGSKILKPDDNREVFQTSNILICYENNKLSFYELFNNSILTKNALENVVITSGKYNLYLGSSSTNSLYAYAFLDSVHLFNNKTFTDEEAEILLKGRNTIDTSNEYYNELAEQFKNPIIQTGYILPNNRYTITGQAKLYSNGYYIRTVQDCEFITTEKENKIELIGTAEVTRLD